MPKVIVATRETSRWPQFAGSTWVRMQYMLGLRKLGIDSYWVDQLKPVDPFKFRNSLDYLAARFHRTAEDFGFADRYCIVYNGGEKYFGMTKQEFLRLADESELVLSISGCLQDESPLMQIPRRALIDVDPGFTQIWAHTVDMGLERHNHFFTVGQNVGQSDFDIPTQGIDWHPIRPPVALDFWPAMIDENCGPFTTVADWRGSQQAEFEGQYYGTKREEFMKLLRLPIDTEAKISPALCIGPKDHEDLGLLVAHNWRVDDAAWRAGDPHSYREYIQFSRAELSVAKHGYVQSNSGWISDRTACYLASGKPALVQSTGFESRLPVGRGLLTFRSYEEAVEGVNEINSDYIGHCHAAREIAETHFDSNLVLESILQRVGL